MSTQRLLNIRHHWTSSPVSSEASPFSNTESYEISAWQVILLPTGLRTHAGSMAAQHTPPMATRQGPEASAGHAALRISYRGCSRTSDAMRKGVRWVDKPQLININPEFLNPRIPSNHASCISTTAEAHKREMPFGRAQGDISTSALHFLVGGVC